MTTAGTEVGTGDIMMTMMTTRRWLRPPAAPAR
jgi:hypothetical protein